MAHTQELDLTPNANLQQTLAQLHARKRTDKPNLIRPTFMMIAHVAQQLVLECQTVQTDIVMLRHRLVVPTPKVLSARRPTAPLLTALNAFVVLQLAQPRRVSFVVAQ